jgi:hypothetical protein
LLQFLKKNFVLCPDKYWPKTTLSVLTQYQMKRFQLINNISGWIAFSIAAIVYILTIEPTTSFWDCGEFITAAYKLQIGHPPGAPFFMLLGRFFSLFAADPGQVAVSINILSALASAFTILFLFWTVTHLARKIISQGEQEFTDGKIAAVIGSGFVGALAYTFSDSFWFSATEAEVYALSSLFTAIVFWAILKWENSADEKHSTRWLILIAYLMGLSIGVHLLNLLAIPAIVFVYYFKKYNPTTKGVLAASAVSIIILGTLIYGIIPGVVIIASYFELFFVNSLGLPFKSGFIFYTLLLIVLIVLGINYTIRKKKVVLNIILLSFTFIIIGYSSFTMIVIRSMADPPMDQNSPDNVFSLLYYLNREQYGDRPLVYGQYYNAPVKEEKEIRPSYIQKAGKYVIARKNISYEYDDRFTTLFPRMYSDDPSHVKEYQSWAEVKGNRVSLVNARGEREVLIKPTFTENLRFFFRYQLGHMYGRYFMWNFAGRQNDIQGHGGILEGNWISGINFLDELRLGPQDMLHEEAISNKARNRYYMLPLLLGLSGLLFHLKQRKKDFWVVMLLFFMTGIAIVVYLNQTPLQPRERDYAYAGSFYAFSIWIGLGVMSLIHVLEKNTKTILTSVLTTLLCLIVVPGIMAKENWDDHDRSKRYTARDFAYNYLNSCAPNAILFTYGDNDTFPLWYAQEVEGIRTDIRVVNLSYLSADWYIEQMTRKAYESDPLPVSLQKSQYVQGTRELIYVTERVEEHQSLKRLIEFVGSDDSRTKLQLSSSEFIDYLPARKFRLPVDSEKVVSNGTVTDDLKDLILPNVDWELGSERNFLSKSDLIILDILATNNWERPVYFAITVPRENYLNLDNFLQIEGLAYRLVPIKNESTDWQIGRIHSDIMYTNMIEQFRWGGINNPGIYLDETNLRMASNFRNNFSRLANQLIEENKIDSALTVLDKCMEVLPHETVPFNYMLIPVIEAYYKAGSTEGANELVAKMAEINKYELYYYFSVGPKFAPYVDYQKQRTMSVMQELVNLAETYEKGEFYENLKAEFEELFKTYLLTIEN